MGRQTEQPGEPGPTDDRPAPWLSADEQATWRAFLLASHHIDATMDRQLQHDSSMTHSHYGILVALSEAPDRSLRMTELANHLYYSQSRTTHAVARLERSGWVRRQPCPTDGRGQIAVLTDAGMDALVAAAPGHVAHVRASLFDRLTPQQQRDLRAICETIAAGPGATTPGDTA
ncbi:MAG: MarR family transcriptional regulator [Actinomycetota bacterium]|nr:MarR family transcriptional regulator [Actinomycetota bacterium]